MRMPATLAISFLATLSSAQDPGRIYFVDNPSPGVFQFSSYDLATGDVAAIEPLPFTGISTGYSSCIDGPGGRYVLCTGTELIVLDVTDAQPPVVHDLPLPAGAYLWNVEYDACSGHFLGMVRSSSGAVSLSTFDPGTQVLSPIHDFGTSMSLCTCPAMFDPQARLYMVRTGLRFIAVDVDLGSVVHNVVIEDLPGLSPFDHLAYDCTEKAVYCTSLGTLENGYGKFLFRLDPATGHVTLLTNEPVPSGHFKPQTGGSCIDEATRTFYWSGTGSTIIGADLSTGNMVHEQSTDAGALSHIEHFSWCPCLVQGVEEASGPRGGISVTTDATAGTIGFSELTANMPVTIHDAAGRLELTFVPRSTTATFTSQFAAGVHVVRSEGLPPVRFVVAY